MFQLSFFAALSVIYYDSNIFYFLSPAVLSFFHIPSVAIPLLCPLHFLSFIMASRVSSVSSISGVSSIERRTQDSNHFMHTPSATLSAHDAQQPRTGQRTATDQVDETVTAEPLLTHRDSGQREDMIAGYEMKDPVQAHRMPYDTRFWYHDWWFWEVTGALLSLASTVAIVVMLAVCNGKSLPVLRNGITLNALLSVLSTIAKVSVRIHPSVRVDRHCRQAY